MKESATSTRRWRHAPRPAVRSAERLTRLRPETRWLLVSLVTVAAWTMNLVILTDYSDDFATAVDGTRLGVLIPVLFIAVAGFAGTGQAIALLVRSHDSRGPSGWFVVPLALAHLVVTLVSVWVAVPATEADDRFDAAMDILVFGGIGWFAVPAALVVLILGAVALGALVVAGVRRIHAAATATDAPAAARWRTVSSGVAMCAGATGAVFACCAIPVDGGGHGGRGAALLVLVLLFLQGVGILASPDSAFFTVIRIGYLVSVILVLQWLVVAVTTSRTTRSSDQSLVTGE